MTTKQLEDQVEEVEEQENFPLIKQFDERRKLSASLLEVRKEYLIQSFYYMIKAHIIASVDRSDKSNIYISFTQNFGRLDWCGFLINQNEDKLKIIKMLESDGFVVEFDVAYNGYKISW